MAKRLYVFMTLCLYVFMAVQRDGNQKFSSVYMAKRLYVFMTLCLYDRMVKCLYDFMASIKGC
ncbi:MAG: hypothetical protein UR21_C0024G0006 [Candidatus Woesebacteria bacterium GW2011_GWC2_31_9]|uniref:Uncharacterized protein n=1 Tax=Candidatus Woesebacteria bacterium GW2011_GWC2_31_9 TaxID=1618586 RepID=A0A0F9YHB3_9BACT|nr:MAG: hypothetical protein UR21_C0024G0006 [Candidatus Woesebacteria bacterium GW2011_GWC2_31_9]